MIDPTEEVLRESLATHAGQRTPRVDLDTVVKAAEARRRRRRVVGRTLTAACLAAAALAVPRLLIRHDDSLGTLAGSPGRADGLADPAQLASSVLDSLGPRADLAGPPGHLALGPVAAADVGTILAGRSRTAGAQVTASELGQGRDWSLVVVVQRLDPTPVGADVRELAASHATAAMTTPLQEDGSAGRPSWIFTSTQGVFGAALIQGGLVVTIDITSGSAQPPRAEMSTVAAGLLRDLVVRRGSTR